MKKNFKFSPEFRANFRGWNNASFGDEQGVEVRDTGTAAFSLRGQLTDSFSAGLGAGVEFGAARGAWGHASLKWTF